MMATNPQRVEASLNPDAFSLQQRPRCLLLGLPFGPAFTLGRIKAPHRDVDNERRIMMRPVPADDLIDRTWKSTGACPFLERGLGILEIETDPLKPILPVPQHEGSGSLKAGIQVNSGYQRLACVG